MESPIYNVGLDVQPSHVVDIPSGNLTQLWKITIFNGKTHYKWPFFNSYVSLPEGSQLASYPQSHQLRLLGFNQIWI